MLNLYRKVVIKIMEDKNMLAMLWANQIIAGKKTFTQVPRQLKPQVAEILRDAGMKELIVE